MSVFSFNLYYSGCCLFFRSVLAKEDRGGQSKFYMFFLKYPRNIFKMIQTAGGCYIANFTELAPNYHNLLAPITSRNKSIFYNLIKHTNCKLEFKNENENFKP